MLRPRSWQATCLSALLLLRHASAVSGRRALLQDEAEFGVPPPHVRQMTSDGMHYHHNPGRPTAFGGQNTHLLFTTSASVFARAAGADPRLATDVECATPRAKLASAAALAEQGCVLEEKVCMDQASRACPRQRIHHRMGPTVMLVPGYLPSLQQNQ